MVKKSIVLMAIAFFIVVSTSYAAPEDNLLYGRPFDYDGTHIYEWTDGDYDTSWTIPYRQSAVYAFEHPVSITGLWVKYTYQYASPRILIKDAEGRVIHTVANLRSQLLYDLNLQNIAMLEIVFDNNVGWPQRVFEIELYGEEFEPDNDPPESPRSLSVSTDDGSAILSWAANTERDLDGYNVYIDGQKHNTGLIKQTHYTLADLINDRTYTAEITAVDYYGNESDKSRPITFIPGIYKIPQPSNLRGVVNEEDSSIVLTWTDGHPNIVGYNVYRKREQPAEMTSWLSAFMLTANAAVEGYEKLNTAPITETTYKVPFTERDKLYEFAITSIDVDGAESDPATLSVRVSSAPSIINPGQAEWGFNAADIFINALFIVVSLAAFILLGIGIMYVPNLIQLIRNAAKGG